MEASATIAVLCFNQAQTIGHVIESAMNQSRKPDEIIVVDDGSYDGSPEIVRSFGDFVRLIVHEENKGRAAARSTALKYASSDVVAYLDGDTTADPRLLESLLHEFKSPEIGAVGAIVRETCITTMSDRWRARHGTAQQVSETNFDAQVLFGWGLSCRRVVALSLGGFRPGSEDIDISIRLRENGYRLVLTPHARVYHTRSDTLQSLLKMVYRWWFGGYIAISRNLDRSLRPHLRRIYRNAYKSIKADLRDNAFDLILIDLLLIPVQIRAVIEAAIYTRTGAIWGNPMRGL